MNFFPTRQEPAREERAWSVTGTRKGVTIILRSIVFITLLLISTHENGHWISWQGCFMLFVFAISNIFLIFQPRRYFNSHRTCGWIFFFDALLVIVFLSVSGASYADLVAAYFLAILVAATSRSTAAAFIAAMVSAIVYGTRSAYGLTDVEAFSTPFFIRLVLFFVTAMFAGYLTEQIEAERRARVDSEQTTERLGGLDRMKSELITMLSHELRTPLTSLSLAAGLIRSGTSSQSTDAERKSVEIIGRSVQRLSRLADDVFLLSQADQGGYPLTAEMVRLLPAVEAALDAVKKETTGASGRTFSIDVPPEACALADADVLSQIVRHLLNNAVMHTTEGTSVDVSCEIAEPGFVDFLVRDDGPGIPEESLRNIFERFYQARKSAGSGYRGVGLGLAICRILVEKTGGRISVESQLGKGTVFRLSLPVGPRGNAQPDYDTARSPRGAKDDAPSVGRAVR